MTTDPTTTDPKTELMAATAMIRSGDRPGGRSRLEALWARVSDDADTMSQCVVAHHLADAQDDPAEELAWDLRALEAGLRCTEADAQRHAMTVSIASLMPSLHTNLAEDYFKLGELALSREHLATAREFAEALSDDAYGQMILRGIERLARKLDA